MISITLALALAALLPQDDPARPLMEQANALFEARKYAEAVEKYGEVLKIDSKHANALYNGGLAAYLGGKPADAAALWERLRAIKPDDLPLLAKLVQAYQSAGDLKKRDACRDALLKARAALPEDEKAKRGNFCRDQFAVNGRRVMAIELYELKGERALRYKFIVLNDEGREDHSISLGSYEMTTQIAREAGEIGKDERMFHLDGYYDQGRTHKTFGMFKKEPSYDEVRTMVVETLEGKKKAASGSEKK
jgi:tetratricopeptide (TPR) repeat protein